MVVRPNTTPACEVGIALTYSSELTKTTIWNFYLSRFIFE